MWRQSVSPHPVDARLRRVKVKKELTSYEKAEKGNVRREAGSKQCAEINGNARRGRGRPPS